MKRFCLTFLGLLSLSFSVVWADSPLVPLLPHAREEYRFQYAGDRTRIEVALDSPAATSLTFLVYTPAQVQALERGEEVEPVGRGTAGEDHGLYWTGSFIAPGVYHIAVENLSADIVQYSLSITGESVTGAGRLVPDPPAAGASLLTATSLTVNLPPGAGPAQLILRVPGPPSSCTHSYEMDAVIYASVKLCPGEIYPPVHILGSGVGLYGDDAHTAVIAGNERRFTITVDGAHHLIEGVTVQASADGADVGAWLCQYDECLFPTEPQPTAVQGGLEYGGGILLRGSDSVIHNVTVRGGTIGIATADGRRNYVLDNQLSDLNGWGSFNLNSLGSYFVGNRLDRENHGCTTPDGRSFRHGCETAGWVCLNCSGNIVAGNHCEGSANCFYMSGERGLGSNNNRLVANYCAGATDNCFEITFSRGNLLQDNVTTADPRTGAACNYPFWIGGSVISFKNNLWQCDVSAEEALARATASTLVPTLLLTGDVLPPALAPALPPERTRVLHPRELCIEQDIRC